MKRNVRRTKPNTTRKQKASKREALRGPMGERRKDGEEGGKVKDKTRVHTHTPHQRQIWEACPDPDITPDTLAERNRWARLALANWAPGRGQPRHLSPTIHNALCRLAHQRGSEARSHLSCTCSTSSPSDVGAPLALTPHKLRAAHPGPPGRASKMNGMDPPRVLSCAPTCARCAPPATGHDHENRQPRMASAANNPGVRRSARLCPLCTLPSGDNGGNNPARLVAPLVPKQGTTWPWCSATSPVLLGKHIGKTAYSSLANMFPTCEGHAAAATGAIP